MRSNFGFVFFPHLSNLHSREVQDCVPAKFFGLQRPQQWLNMVTQHMQQVQALSPHQARAQFLGRTNIYFFKCNMFKCTYSSPPCQKAKSLRV